MKIKDAIARLLERQSLSRAEMRTVFSIVMSGGATDAQIGGLLVALRMKGETIDEIVGAVELMRELALPVDISGEHLVDIVGTGGDGSSIFNVSTASSFVVAAAGGQVAKHGGRAVSSKSGAADLLEAAGVRLDMSPAEVVRCVKEVGVGFMFAVNHHAAMKHAMGPRRELGARTLFNLLGPLSNPAGVKKMLLGVYGPEWLRPTAEVLKVLGAEHVLVVHSADGLDEISIAGPTDVVELRAGEILEYRIKPEDFGLQSAPLESLVVRDAADSLALIQRAFSKGNKAEVASDMVALNAGAALYAADVASSLAQGVALAEDAIGSGLAKEKIGELADFTRLMSSEEA